jgi:hypothetical protein
MIATSYDTVDVNKLPNLQCGSIMAKIGYPTDSTSTPYEGCRKGISAGTIVDFFVIGKDSSGFDTNDGTSGASLGCGEFLNLESDFDTLELESTVLSWEVGGYHDEMESLVNVE